MADQAKGKEDEEDGEDYSEVIEVLKQYIKSHKRVIASQSSDIKTLLLSLNTLKASVKDSVSAIKNISSTLASLTNSSNTVAATTGKTSYSPRFDPFSGTMDLDFPLRPSRKEPYLGPAIDNTATSNLDLPIDTGSKEGFKDTITSSIVKELSKKAYTILDDKNPDISNTYSDSNQAVLLMLLRDSLSSSPRAAISWIYIPSKAFKLLVRQYSRPIESKKEDVYNKFHTLTFSTYRKGLSAFNAKFNGYLAKLTIAKIDINPSLILNYLNIEYLRADILEESRNPAIEAYRAAYMANSSNSTPNLNSNPSKKGKNQKKGKKKASYNIKGQNYSAKSAEQASFMLGSYNLAIEEEEESDFSSNSSSSSNSNTQLPRRRPRDPALYNSWLYNTGSTDHISNSKERPASIGSIILEVLSRKAPPTYTKLVLDNVLYLPNIDINIVSRVRHYDSEGCLIKETLYGGDRRCIAVLDFKKSGFFLNVKGSSKPILYTNFAFPLGLSSYTTKSIEPPIIEDAIVSEAIEPNKRYKLRNSPAKGTTLEGIGPFLRGKRPCRPTREPKPLTGTRDLPYILREPVIEGNEVEKAISSPTLKEPNIGYIGLRLLKKTSSITKGLPNFNKIKEANFHCSSCDRGKAVRRVSKALIPDLPRVLDLIEGDTVKIRPRPYNRNPIVLLLVDRKINSTAITYKETTPFQALFDELEPGILYIPDLEHYRAIGARGEAIIPLEKQSKSLKFISRTEKYKLLVVLGSKTYLVYILSRRAVLKTSTVKFIEDNTVLSQPTDNTALEGELVDLDLDLEGAVSLDPSNLNTKKPISIEIGPSKLEPYKSSSNKPIFAPKPIEVIAPNQPIINEPLNNNDLILEGDKIQLDYYKLLAKTSSYILSFVYKARKRVIFKDSTPTTYKQVLKLPRDKRSKWLEAITKEFIQLLELEVFKFLPKSLLPSNYKLITCRNVLKVKKDAKNKPIKEEIYIEIPKGLLDLAASNKAIYKLLLKYSYNPSTPNIIKLSKALYSLKQSPREWQDKLKILLKSLGYLPLISDLGVFYNAKTCHFIVTYIDDCLFIGPDIGYITDLKKQLNKVYAIEDLGPAAYFLGYLNSTKDYSICFSYNGNTAADLGPKLSNSGNTTTKLSRDFHSKEGPRPLTTTSTTIVDSRNSKGSSRTSIISSSLVPIGFSDSDFIGDKATSKSTYSYLYKLASRPISWKTKRATTIALSTLEAETNGLTEAIREVQWIIGLFSELYRPIDHPITLYRDNQGSITVANDPALYVRTKYTLLKFRYIRE
ncbi:hypothetical protein P8C59_001013 [Phyllachora maydis]|uniref:Reverse transcriptase Ty1/copia-type domain-containing protein n=1 Tax=Phyllachora maydis TaxID=1825666 RepID=A0AAD9HYV6_9PEZI|nr:hypothetical protein P8C59_001013 [Phyllachora maydis]